MDDILDQVRRLQNNTNEVKEEVGNEPEEKQSKIKGIVEFYFKYIHWVVAILFYSCLINFGVNYILKDFGTHQISFVSSIIAYILYDIFLLNKIINRLK